MDSMCPTALTTEYHYLTISDGDNIAFSMLLNTKTHFHWVFHYFVCNIDDTITENTVSVMGVVPLSL